MCCVIDKFFFSSQAAEEIAIGHETRLRSDDGDRAFRSFHDMMMIDDRVSGGSSDVGDIVLSPPASPASTSGALSCPTTPDLVQSSFGPEPEADVEDEFLLRAIATGTGSLSSNRKTRSVKSRNKNIRDVGRFLFVGGTIRAADGGGSSIPVTGGRHDELTPIEKLRSLTALKSSASQFSQLIRLWAAMGVLRTNSLIAMIEAKVPLGHHVVTGRERRKASTTREDRKVGGFRTMKPRVVRNE